MVNMYEWLSIPNNIKRLNFNVMSEEDIPEQFKKLSWISGLEKNITDQDINEIRNTIMFKNPNEPLTSELNNPEDIDDLIQLATYTSKNDSKISNDVDSTIKMTNSLNYNDKVELFKNILNDDNYKNLILSLLKK